MHPTPPFSRRRFLATAALAGVVLGSRPALGAGPRPPVCFFEKPVQHLPFDELAAVVSELGFAGIEATVRPGGHIAPEAAADELPGLVAALREHGLEVTVMATNISAPDGPETEPLLRTAAGLGIKRYRLAHLHYRPGQPVVAQLDDLRPRFAALAALNAELGIQGLYQNHAGHDYIGAPLWDLAHLLEGIDPAHLGVAYDVRHAAVEGGTSWPMTLDMVRPHIGMVYVKDFVWDSRRPKNVPLGDGRVDPGALGRLYRDGSDAPVSLHIEYLGTGGESPMETITAAARRDHAVLRRWLEA